MRCAAGLPTVRLMTALGTVFPWPGRSEIVPIGNLGRQGITAPMASRGVTTKPAPDRPRVTKGQRRFATLGASQRSKHLGRPNPGVVTESPESILGGCNWPPTGASPCLAPSG